MIEVKNIDLKSSEVKKVLAAILKQSVILSISTVGVFHVQ
jgi:hypothetical protein